jgi:hypothetical protein
MQLPRLAPPYCPTTDDTPVVRGHAHRCSELPPEATARSSRLIRAPTRRSIVVYGCRHLRSGLPPKACWWRRVMGMGGRSGGVEGGGPDARRPPIVAGKPFPHQKFHLHCRSCVQRWEFFLEWLAYKTKNLFVRHKTVGFHVGLIWILYWQDLSSLFLQDSLHFEKKLQFS